jgi:hypothetical protein
VLEGQELAHWQRQGSELFRIDAPQVGKAEVPYQFPTWVNDGQRRQALPPGSKNIEENQPH